MTHPSSGSAGRRPRVALIGAGAIGMAVASGLLRAGRAVVVCGGHAPIHRIEVTEHGTTSAWAVEHTDDPTTLGDVDTAIVAVKAQQTDSAADWLRAVARPQVTVLVAQNGVEQRERVAPYLGQPGAGASPTDAPQVVPAIVYLNVERLAPGRARVNHVGDVDLAFPVGEAARELADELTHGGLRVRLGDDFAAAAWRKLLTNISANPLTALTGRRAEVLHEPAIRQAAGQLMAEAVTVAQAAGIHLTHADATAALDWLATIPGDATTSMLSDRLAARPLEYDALTGAVVRTAARVGVEVPANKLMLALLSALPSGEGPHRR
ncbi:ketopantoate reductase family protein [Propionibacterium freudenreichii]|uniref:ketopantoate reductase family protein n=1 Tax=Propionibacterium freudenreichii TaxID=1744 RepID=UPI000543E323|nr:2-dehydropantoate 2-reductase [Propionibacterium freudenreichii]MCT2975034.1 2-dehydropantoate 2-reductase [Propionibacterium freudenreichii]MCT2980083.1 2-dehydropantoate 2-reductase [Propionibacterium freudenreichii]MDK9350253.1 2-dehydropantoate 2-reductase [Propionibacterium freudenreichii]CEG92660.1 Putative 2-dehydropantoate 2-reductase (Ketopantoate reductase) (KPA reductase) (KPR) [Propionibacterium freudenreichii]